MERNADVNSIGEAKRMAKQASASGKTINAFQQYPKFFAYLQNKKDQTNNCRIRVYHDNIYIWRGRNHILVTAHPIPDRYKQEMKEIDDNA